MSRVGPIAVVVIVAVAVGSQLLLPRIAEHRLRSQLSENGTVDRVSVHAFPAVKLLFGHADRVSVHMSQTGAGRGRLADLLAHTRDTKDLDVRVDELRVLLLRLHDVRLRKRGKELIGSAAVSQTDLRAALPPGFDLQPVASGAGELVFQGSVRLLGAAVSARAVVLASEGRLRIAPDVPFGGLAALTIFDDPRIEVEAVGARTSSGGFTLTARARLR